MTLIIGWVEVSKAHNAWVRQQFEIYQRKGNSHRKLVTILQLGISFIESYKVLGERHLLISLEVKMISFKQLSS